MKIKKLNLIEKMNRSIPDSESNLDFDYSKFTQYYDIRFNQNTINDLPPLNVESLSNVTVNDLPPYLNRMMKYGAMYGDQKQILMERFGMYYLHYPEFRELVDGWVILILACKYHGIYPDEQTCINETRRLKIPGSKIHLSPMYLNIIGYEYSETKSTSYGYIINDFNKEGKKICRFNNQYYKVNIQYNHNEQDIKHTEKYIVDTGCTNSHALLKNYIKYPDYEYSQYPFDENNQQIIKKILKNPNYFI